ncbi:CrcB family protein [Bacillus sp. FJAT-29814]|uniref:fluoride efflux transporter FluC n=1 Tax=Bacillus sp. FJAT-29814 TaxID=1729688 RepID=UPI0008358C3C|nr:CrcB family protein [Bacillus sp. FJAT-29814]
MMKFLLIIGAGGFCGAISRYYLSNLFSKWTILSIPTATFIINVLGSLAAGFIYGRNNFTNEQLSFLTIGFLASFTTFSTFNYELLRLNRGNKHIRFFLYGTAMYLTCILAACCGYLWGE